MRAAVVVFLGIGLLFALWNRRGAPMPPAADASSPSVTPRETSLANESSSAPMRIALDEPRSPAEESSPAVQKPTLRGRLIDATGTGVAGTVVLYESADARPLAMRRREIPTADDGAFALPLDERSRYVVLGIADGYWTSPLLEITGSQPQPEVTLELRELAKLRGVVVDEHGVPRAGGRLDLSCPELLERRDRVTPWNREGVRPRTALVAQDGSFVFAVAPDRGYDLTYHPRVDQPVFVQWHDIRAAQSPVSLTARSEDLRCTRVAGTVRDADGSPVTSYAIQVDGGVWRTIADASGRFDVYAKWGTQALVLVRHDGQVHRFESCRIGGDAPELSLQLPRPGTLVVRVTDRAGEPMDDVAVVAEIDVPVQLGALDSSRLLAARKIEGRTRYFAELSPGRYRVTAIAVDRSEPGGERIDWNIAEPRIESAETTTTVRSGVEQSIEIVLPVR